MAQGDPWGFLDEHAPTATKAPEGDWSFLDEHEPPDTSGFQIGLPVKQPEMQAPEAPGAPDIQGAEPGFMQPGVGGIESVPRTGPDRPIGEGLQFVAEEGPGQFVRSAGTTFGKLGATVAEGGQKIANMYFPGSKTQSFMRRQQEEAPKPFEKIASDIQEALPPPKTTAGKVSGFLGGASVIGPLGTPGLALQAASDLRDVYKDAKARGLSDDEADKAVLQNAGPEFVQLMPLAGTFGRLFRADPQAAHGVLNVAKGVLTNVLGTGAADTWRQVIKNNTTGENGSLVDAFLEHLPETALGVGAMEVGGLAAHGAAPETKGAEQAKPEARPGGEPPPAVQERPTSGVPEGQGSQKPTGETTLPQVPETGQPGETTEVQMPRRAVERPGQPERRQNTDFRQQLEQADQEAALKALQLHNAGDETGALAVMQEHAKARTEAVAAEHVKARTDAGTGLPNKHAWAERDHEGQTRTSIDLDGLGAINDQYGHEAGNAYLRKAAEVFKEEFPEGEIARTGGDEFEADAPHTAEAEARMQRVQEKLANVTVDLGVHDGERVTKKGIGLSWGHGEDAATADAEMYKHKAARTEAGERRPGKETEQPGITRTKEAEAPPAPEPARPAEAAPELPGEPAPAAEPPKGPGAAKGKPGETFEEQRARYTPFQKEVEAEVQAEIEAGKNAPEPPESAPLESAAKPREAVPEPKSAPEAEPEPTGTKNAVTAAEREARGVSPIEDHIRRSMPETWRMAEEKANADPSLGDRIVKGEAVQGLERDVREAVLLREKVGAQNEAERIDKALAEAQASGDEAGVKALSDQADAAEARNTEIDQAAKREGVEWGRSGRIRQMLVARDYSIASLQSKLRAAKGGKALTAEERASAAAHSEKLIALEKRVQEVEAQLREKQTAKAEKAMTPSGKKRLLERLDQAAEEARARLAAKRGRAGGGLPFDPQDIADVARIVASDLAHGIDWTANAIKNFGEGIKPHLEAVLAQAKKLHRDAILGDQEGKPAPDELGMRSTLEDAASTKLPERGTGVQFLKTLENQKGISPEEVEWSGIRDFLKGKLMTSKAEVLDFLKRSNVKVEEKKLGKIDEPAGNIQRLPNGKYALDYPSLGRELFDTQAAAEVEQRRLQKLYARDETKFSRYQLPGGENYRELLLTLPGMKGEFKGGHYDQPDVLVHMRVNDRQSLSTGKAGPNRLSADTKLLSDLVERPAFEAEGLGGLDIKDREAVKAGVIRAVGDDQIRRSVVEGIPVEVVNEIVRGKSTPEKFLNDKAMLADSLSGNQDAAVRLSPGAVRGLVRTIADLAAKRVEMGANLAGASEGGRAAPEAGGPHKPNRMLFIEEIQSDLHQKGRRQGYGEGIPDAPFKKTWHELALKRAIRYAAENGYDSVGWTTGEQQAERYDLSKRLSDVAYYPTVGGGTLEGYDHDGNRVVNQRGVAPKDLSDYIGKDAADKLLASEQKHAPRDPDSPYHEIRGEDLKVGGEGMRGFYDKMLPAAAEKIGKVGGAEVKEGGITSDPGYPYRAEKVGDEWRLVDKNGGDMALRRPDREAVQREVDKANEAAEKVPVHEMPLTPALKTVATEQGFPRFGTEGAKAPQSAILDFIGKKADEARARIKERGPRAMAGVDPADMLDRTIVGAHYLAQDIVKIADWSAAMVRELGEDIRPHLEDLYAKSKAFLESTKKQVGSEEGAIKRYAKGAEKYRARTEAGDFETPPKPEQLPWTPERAKAKTDFEAARKEFEQMRSRKRFENRTTGQKARDVAREALNLPKQIMTGFDMSATLFQGGIQSATHPIISAKALKESVRALVSERKSLEVDTALRNRPKAAEGEKAGLELTSLDGPLSAHEEHMRSNWAGKLPIIGKGVEASNRAFTTFLNVQRALTFDKLTEAMSDKSPKAQNAIANFINVSTGRGYTPAKFKAAMSAAANVLWSPRLMVSRFQLLAGQPLYRGTASSRMAIAGEYAKALGALGAVYAVSALAGNDVEKDPRSSNFGKIKIGNTYLDPTLGLSQVTTLLERIRTGETKTQTGKIEPLRTPIFGKGKGPGFGQSTVADVGFRFLRTKFSPTIGIPMDVLSGKNVAGQPVTPGSAAQEALVPLAFQDVYKAMMDRGIPEGAALGLLSIFGAHIQVHEKIKKAG